MKKTNLLICILSVCLLLTAFAGCKQEAAESTPESIAESAVEQETSTSQPSTSEIIVYTENDPMYIEALVAYEEFLRGERPFNSRTADTPLLYITEMEQVHFTVMEYEEVERRVTYALYDMNGDGIPELHLTGFNGYLALTYYNNELISWFHGGTSGSSHSYYPTESGNVLYIRPGAAPPHITYQYLILNYFGREIERIYFAKYDVNMDGEYTETDANVDRRETDAYYFEDEQVTKAEWDELTEEYFADSIDFLEWLPVSRNVILTV